MPSGKMLSTMLVILAASAVIFSSAAVIKKRNVNDRERSMGDLNKWRSAAEAEVQKAGGTLNFPPLEYDTDLEKTAEGLVGDCSKWKHGAGYRFFAVPDPVKLTQMMAQGPMKKRETIEEGEKIFTDLFKGDQSLSALEMLNPAAKTMGCAEGGSCSGEVKIPPNIPGIPPQLKGASGQYPAKGICLVATSEYGSDHDSARKAYEHSRTRNNYDDPRDRDSARGNNEMDRVKNRNEENSQNKDGDDKKDEGKASNHQQVSIGILASLAVIILFFF